MSRSKDATAIGRSIAQDCVALRARKLSRRISRIYDEELRSLGVKSSQLTILAATAAMPGSRPADLHRRLALEQSTFSRNAAVLKRSGWLRESAGDDERSQTLFLTRDGEILLKEALPRWRAAQRKARSLLGGDAADDLIDLVDRSLLSTTID